MGAEHSRLNSNSCGLIIRKRLSLPVNYENDNGEAESEERARGQRFHHSVREPSRGGGGVLYDIGSVRRRPDGEVLHQSASAPLPPHSDRLIASAVKADLQFSELEEDILLSSWPLVEAELMPNGRLVFSHAFKIFPHLESFFPFSRNEIDSLKDESSRGLTIIRSFMQLLGRAIACLQNPSNDFIEELLLLGAKHALIPNMKVEYFKVFKQAVVLMLESIMYEEFTDEIKQAWMHLMDAIIAVMSEGCLVFEEEEEKRLCNSSDCLPQEGAVCDSVDSSNTRFSLTVAPNDEGQFDAETGQPYRRASGRPSVISMTVEELGEFYAKQL